MNRILLKELFRTIKRNPGRFASIVAIIALGVGFFAGINATKPDMIKSAALYFKENNLMDIRSMNPLGYSDEELDKVKNVPGVETMEISYRKDLFLTTSEVKAVARIFSFDTAKYSSSDTQNRLYLVEGRLPEESGEIVVSKDKFSEKELNIGDTVELSVPEGEELKDSIKRKDFVVVGKFDSPLYMSYEKEHTNVGTGKVQVAAYIPLSDFSMKEPSEIFVKVAGVSNLLPTDSLYKSKVSEVKNQIDEIGKNFIAKETADLKATLEKNKKELTDKKADAQKQLADGEAKLVKAEADLANGETTLLKEETEGRKKIADGRAETLKNKTQLIEGRLQYNAGYLEWSKGNNEYLAGKAKLDASKAELDSARVRLDSTKAILAQSKAQLDSSKAQLDIMKNAIDGMQEILDAIVKLPEYPNMTEAQYKEMIERVRKYSPESADFIEKYMPYVDTNMGGMISGFLSTTLDSLKAQYESGKLQYDQGLAQYEDGLKQYNEGEAQYADGLAQYEAGAAKLAAAKEQVDAGKAKLDETKKTLDDGDAKLDLALLQLDTGEKELNEKVAKGKEDIKKGKDELAKNKETFKKTKEDTLKKLADADDEILKAERDIADIPSRWFVYDRDGNPDYTSWFDNAEKIGQVAIVFPFFFFLVAALVSLTNITRIVEEERTQAGTLKALGYNDSSVSSKYLLYGFAASVLGSLIGLIAGFNIFPSIIIQAYTIMYNLPYRVIEFNWFYGLLSIGLALLSAVGAAYAAATISMKEVPAQLMQPKAPPAGKRIFLERIRPIWSRLSFSRKVTFRNLFLYKKRFWMTVIGISGCTALILTGFGIKNSVDAIVENQFTNLFVYHEFVALDTKRPAAEREPDKIASSVKNVKSYKATMSQSMKVHVPGSDRTYDATLLVPQTTGGLDNFVVLRDRKTHAPITLPKDGAVISEKMSDLLGVKVGDELSYEDTEKRQFKVKITALTENYVNNYIYMTPEVYRTVHLMVPDYNGIWVKLNNEGISNEETVKEDFLKNDAVVTVVSTLEISNTFAEQMRSLNFVVAVLIISAGALALIVLYNLSNVNITERQRELATIKVLGFRDNEVTAYVYRENIFLTAFGSILGLGLGFLLHKFIMTTLEITNMMFGKKIHFFSFFIAVAITFAFSALVNIIMHHSLKKIDMVESLKSVE